MWPSMGPAPPLGDPIEVGALSGALANGARPASLGSVKVLAVPTLHMTVSTAV